jgi:signal transduction histidine kinase/ligand-binding sensor domain-containing protein
MLAASISPRERPPIGRSSFFVGILLSCRAFAIDPTEYLSELHHTQWTTREGAPGAISVIAQTSDGYLWLGTPIGLFRFDGESFEQPTFSDGKLSINGDVSALYTTPSGDLWIGMRFGGAYFLRNGRLTKYAEQQGLPLHTIRQFAATPDGAVWAALTNGLFRLRETGWAPVGNDWNYSATDAYNIFVARNGTLWARSFQGTFFLPNGAKAFEKSPVPGGRGWIFSAPDGSIWVSDPEQGLTSLTDAARAVPKFAVATDSGTQAAFADLDGGLWICVMRAGTETLLRLPSGKALLENAKQLTDSDVQTLRPTQSLTGATFNFMEDREGNVWAATDSGLDRFRPNKLHSALETVSRVYQAVMTASPQGDMWLAGEPDLLLKFSANQTVPIADKRFRTSDLVNTAWGERDGSILLGLERVGLTRYANGQAQTLTLWSHAEERDIQAIVKDHDDKLWVSGVREGLYRQDGNVWTLNGGLSDLPAKVPLSAFADSTGKLWFGYPDNEIALVENGRVRIFDHAQGLNIGAVLAIASRAERLWIGGTDNVALYAQGHFSTLTNIDGRAFTGVSGIVQDSAGTLWLNGSTGVTRIAGPEIDAFATDPGHRVKVETMNHEDGLNGVATQIRPLNTALEGADGRVWFTTAAGAYWIDPKHVRRNALPPPVILKSFTANGRNYPINGEIHLPAHTTSLEFKYSALSLSMPNRARFKYKLDGVDTEWQDAGNRRQAFYTNVPPGTHRFQVIAANEDDIWNDTGASANLTIAPAFFQTRWFDAACALAVLATLWQLYRTRVRLIARQMRVQMGARLEERERIARELHDTLLQSTQGLILLFQSFAGRLGRADPMRRQMEAALDQADHLLNEARDRVSDLRTTGIDSDMTRALSRFVQELISDRAVGFKIVEVGSPMVLSLSVADDAYRIGREALSNAVSHAQPANIELEIAYDAKQFRMRVRDDGKGIADELLRAGARAHHFGLQGMRERAERNGGTLNIWSRDGAGTEVELTVPAARAYRRYRAKPHWIRAILLKRRPSEPS